MRPNVAASKWRCHNGALQRVDQSVQSGPQRRRIHPDQNGVIKRVLHHLLKFGVILIKHAQLLAAGDRRAVGLLPSFGHGFAGFCSPGFCWALTISVTLKMNLPSNCSRLTEP